VAGRSAGSVSARDAGATDRYSPGSHRQALQVVGEHSQPDPGLGTRQAAQPAAPQPEATLELANAGAIPTRQLRILRKARVRSSARRALPGVPPCWAASGGLPCWSWWSVTKRARLRPPAACNRTRSDAGAALADRAGVQVRKRHQPVWDHPVTRKPLVGLGQQPLGRGDRRLDLADQAARAEVRPDSCRSR
jgi:hypothetical protein